VLSERVVSRSRGHRPELVSRWGPLARGATAGRAGDARAAAGWCSGRGAGGGAAAAVRVGHSCPSWSMLSESVTTVRVGHNCPSRSQLSELVTCTADRVGHAAVRVSHGWPSRSMLSESVTPVRVGQAVRVGHTCPSRSRLSESVTGTADRVSHAAVLVGHG
jgi:hypothetical protein